MPALAGSRVALLVASALMLLTGCTVHSVGQVGAQPREVITYAARASYPGKPQPPTEKVDLVAMYDGDRQQLRVYNLTTQPIEARAIWVDGVYVRQLYTIAPKGRAVVSYGELIQAGAGVKDFSQTGDVPHRVEVETADGLFTARGPVAR